MLNIWFFEVFYCFCSTTYQRTTLKLFYLQDQIDFHTHPKTYYLKRLRNINTYVHTKTIRLYTHSNYKGCVFVSEQFLANV